ncbi:MAG: 30S ribosomal protein S6 [bacterium]|nr:30S ribosomal protein S6 [bacterium]
MIEDTQTQIGAKYELMLIIPPDLGEDGSRSELDEVRKLISSCDGEIFHEDIWGVRDLATRRKKYDQGYYAVFNLNLAHSRVKEIEVALNINSSIVKYLFLRTEMDYEIKTLVQYQAEEEAIKKEKEKEKEENKKDKSGSKPEKVSKPRPKKEEVKKEEPIEKTTKEVDEIEENDEAQAESPGSETSEAKSETAEVLADAEAKEKPKAEEDAKVKLDEVDEKLKSIINDPDISL